MIIWLINQYNSLPEHGHLNRNYNLAKALVALDHQPVVMSGSSPHNTETQLINGSDKFIVNNAYGFPYIYIKTEVYGHSKKRQIIEMFRFYKNVHNTIKHLQKPDVIVGSSMHPLVALLAIRLSRKYHCKCVVEIRDLWPESMIAYGYIKRDHPIAKLMCAFERYLYKAADAIVFTMPGGANYIREKGWDTDSGGPITMEKVYYINNGVDLEAFDHNVIAESFTDTDLSDKDWFNVVYTGSIRFANNMDIVLDAAKLLQATKARFLIWGTGSELERLRQRCLDERISNVIFKGSIKKNQVPSILTQADVTFFVLHESPLYRFGLSLNKSFEYFAAAKPTIIIGEAGYSLVEQYHCGLHIREATPEGLQRAVRTMLSMKQSEYAFMSSNARRCASEFDFSVLGQRMVNVIEGTIK